MNPLKNYASRYLGYLILKYTDIKNVLPKKKKAKKFSKFLTGKVDIRLKYSDHILNVTKTSQRTNDFYLYDENLNIVQLISIWNATSEQLLSIKNKNISHIDMFDTQEKFLNLASLLNPKLKSLATDWHFEESCDNLPKKLELFYASGYLFNGLINKLPKKLKSLIISSNNFNQSVTDLPSKLKDLVINSNVFNQDLSHLPNKLRALHITSNMFDKNIYKLPLHIKNVTLHSSPHLVKQGLEKLAKTQVRALSIDFFNVSVLEMLPKKLRQLSLSSKINDPSKNNTLTENIISLDHIQVEKLELATTTYDTIVSYPKNLRRLKFLTVVSNYHKLGFHLLENLETLILHNVNIKMTQYPKNLKMLKFDHYFNQKLVNLPAKLEILILGVRFNKSLNNIPETLQKLIIKGSRVISNKCDFNKSLNNFLRSAKNLQILKIDLNHSTYTKKIKRLPPNLKTLYLGNSLIKNLKIFNLFKELKISV